MQVYPKTVEEKLGFDVLRRRIESLTLCELGRDRLAGMRLSSDVDTVRHEIERVSELQQALRFDDPIPFQHVRDVRRILDRAAPDGALVAAEDLALLRRVLATIRLLHAYFQRRRAKYPLLWRVASGLTPQPEIEQRIDQTVDDEGAVRDTASDELHRLRRLIIRRRAQLRDTLAKELRSAIRLGYATEEQPTIRNGRMVIPVRAEARRKIQGFVQDVSGSGQTIFVEPASCLELNNELRELEGEERREVERILREVTSAVRARLAEMREAMNVLGTLDLLQARARLSNEIDAVVPQLNDAGIIDVQHGRNPLLLLRARGFREDARGTEPRGGAVPGAGGTELRESRVPESGEDARSRDAREGRSRKHVSDGTRGDVTDRTRGDATDGAAVVPLSLSLGEHFRTLIITGPNAGGKTVAMKTVGLFSLMLSYGLPIPADETSRFAVFERLLVDVGDEQSIEEDLSTFSSHVSNLRYMIDYAGPRTLVLIDEAGTGTDPAEGGALALAVLEELTHRGARTIATTHHGTLKAFAHETDGVENGSMEFDHDTLSPTYRFRPGIPGSSYAFEIARRMGLDERVLEQARALVGVQEASLEDLVTTFERRTQELAARIAEAEEEVRQARHEREVFRQRSEKLTRERDHIRRQALEEAERIVRSANARIERTIREIKEAQAARDVTLEARAELEAFRGRVSEQIGRKGDRPAEDVPPGERSPEESEWTSGTVVSREPARRRREIREKGVRTIDVGDQVVLDGGSTTAEVLEIDGGEAVITFDSMRLRTNLTRLRKVGGPREQQAHVGRVERSGPLASARSRIDLRGRRVDEALDAVTRLIDDAVAAGLNDVEILHGTGTGALRMAIQEYLAGREDVLSCEEAPWDQGGAGVTRVRLG